jgi:hypothetical protein
MATKIKKRKKTDTVEESNRYKRNTANPGSLQKHQYFDREDNKGIVKGREASLSRKRKNVDGEDDIDQKTTFKEVNVGPFSYRRSTEGTKKKGKKHTDFTIFGKSVYNKDKDISPEKSDKIHAKTEAKLLKRYKKQYK